MSDKPIVRDYDHTVAPGVQAHTHEETKAGKHSYEHKAETGFEGPNIEGSAYEKTKITLADDSNANKHQHDQHSTSGSSALHGSSHHSSGHHTSATSGSATSTHTSSDAHQGHHDASLTSANKPIVRDYDYQPAPGVAAHTHEVIKAGKHTYEHKAETGFEGPNIEGSAYEKTKVTLAEDSNAKSHHDHSTSGSSALHGSSHHTSGTGGSATTTHTSSELDTHGHQDASLTSANKPIVRDYDYQPAPGVEAHTHEVIKTGKNTYEHKAETTFEGPNTTGSAYEKTTVKMSKH